MIDLLYKSEIRLNRVGLSTTRLRGMCGEEKSPFCSCLVLCAGKKEKGGGYKDFGDLEFRGHLGIFGEFMDLGLGLWNIWGF